MEMERHEHAFVARFHHGKYNAKGAWVDDALPNEAEAEIMRTQTVFQGKVQTVLSEQFELAFELHKDSEIIVE
jgi:sigma factor-binding protein Crl